MAKSVYLVTRYSVVSKGQHTWQIARQASDFESYRSAVLDEDRLERRLRLFREITIPSVCTQATQGAALNWLVLVAAELPAQHRSALAHELELATAAGVRVLILPVAASDDAADPAGGLFAGVGQAIRMTLESDFDGADQMFATVRLDDDDALAGDFTSRLEAYLKPEFAGMHVSFSRGLQAIYIDGTLTDARLVDKPLIALGLAFVSTYEPASGFAHPEIHVHGFGNHARLSERTPVILDGSKVSFLRTLDSSSDLGDAGHSKNPAVSVADVAALGLNLKIVPPDSAAESPQEPKRGWFRR